MKFIFDKDLNLPIEKRKSIRWLLWRSEETGFCVRALLSGRGKDKIHLLFLREEVDGEIIFRIEEQ